MATQPQIIKNIFISKDEGREKGFYSISLCKNGIFSEVIIDDFLPSIGQNQQLCKSEESNASLWPMMMEKAYAKLYGCYSNIGIEGFTGNAINDFTGAPYTEHDITLTKVEEVKKILKNSVENQKY